jgi:hypothetical protein
MSTSTARQHASLYKGNEPGPKDSGIFCKAAVRALIEHGPEDGDVRASAKVRATEAGRTEADPYVAEASRLLDAALVRAGATKRDLARALVKDEKWIRKLTDPDAAPTLSLGNLFRLRQTAPRAFETIREAIASLDSPPPLHAPTAAEQRRVLARAFAELMAADDGQPSVKALGSLRQALDGYEAVIAKEAASCR